MVACAAMATWAMVEGAREEAVKATAAAERAPAMAAADLAAAEGVVLVVAVVWHNHGQCRIRCSHPYRRCIYCTSRSMTEVEADSLLRRFQRPPCQCSASVQEAAVEMVGRLWAPASSQPEEHLQPLSFVNRCWAAVAEGQLGGSAPMVGHMHRGPRCQVLLRRRASVATETHARPQESATTHALRTAARLTIGRRWYCGFVSCSLVTELHEGLKNRVKQIFELVSEAACNLKSSTPIYNCMRTLHAAGAWHEVVTPRKMTSRRATALVPTIRADRVDRRVVHALADIPELDS